MRPAVRVVLILHLFASFAGSLRAEQVLPDLDILVISKIGTIKEIQDNYIATLQRQVVAAFASLRAQQVRSVDNTPPKDGTAQYRLVVEHTGSVVIGNQITTERINQASAIGGGGWTRFFYIEARQTGTLAVKLMKWDEVESKYKDVEKWTAPMPLSDRETDTKGKVEVGKTMGGFSSTDDAKCSTTLQEAQKIACLSIQPGNVRDVLLGKLIQVSATKAAAKPLEPQKGGGFLIEGELSVKNNSPWPLKRFQSMVMFAGGVFLPGTGPVEMHGAAPWVELPEPLAPGASTKIAVTGKERKNQKQGIQNAEFIPSK